MVPASLWSAACWLPSGLSVWDQTGHPHPSTFTGADDTKVVWFLRRHGFLAVFLMCVCPIVPCEIVSLTSGALALPLGSFALASLLGMLPGSILYAAFGSSLLDPEAVSIRLGSLAGFAALTLITGVILWRLWRSEPVGGRGEVNPLTNRPG